MLKYAPPPDMVSDTAKKGPASVFLGNIAYDCDDDEMRRILRTAGPF